MSNDNSPKKLPISLKLSPIVFSRVAEMCDINNETRNGVIERAINLLWERFIDEQRQMKDYRDGRIARDFVDGLIGTKK